MESIIEFKDVSKEFEGNVVLKDLNFQVKKGEIFVLVGPSGSGKTNQRLQYSEATLADWLCFTADRFISYHER